MSPDPTRTASLVMPAFPELSTAACAAMNRYADVLAKALPMKAAHRRQLPDNIRDLSMFLTTDRADLLGRDYLHAPQALGAYLWHFLPWNMLRLARTLAGLDLDLALKGGESAVIVDLGAGPLTLVQALALARPDLLSRQLHFYCLDSTPRPMRLGRTLYFGLLDLLGTKSKWKTHLVHAPWKAGLRDVPQADLITATNFLNEMAWRRSEPLNEQVDEFFADVSGPISNAGQCLFVEPGNRLGGKLTSMIRESAVVRGWNVLAPCTHVKPCPMLGNVRETSWCHFTVSTQGCPDWLAALSREAKLAKRDLSLSFAHVCAPHGRRPGRPGEAVRVISNEFALPDDQAGPRIGRYACSARGKVLLVSRRGEPGTRSGDVVSLELGQSLARDAKSQALIASLHPGSGQKTGRHGPGAARTERAGLDKRPKKWNKVPRERKGIG